VNLDVSNSFADYEEEIEKWKGLYEEQSNTKNVDKKYQVLQ
jgi:hypothetical protein